MKCVNTEDDEDEESILTAVAHFTSMRRIITIVEEDPDIMIQIEQIIYPCLEHSLTVNGLDSIEESIDCIALLIQNIYKGKTISEALWKLYP